MSDNGPTTQRRAIPRDAVNDYTHGSAERRRAFIRELSGVDLTHVAKYSFDPSLLQGNIENFIGAAQVPIGVAGPLRINGEHAQGDFFVPLATTEGALVASYNRGMRLLTECGGVKTTIVERSMQRAPVFVFEDAASGRAFGRWIDDNFGTIKQQAEATSRIGKLIGIQQFVIGPLRHLRFNYTTGDAAGQNMVGKATLAACQWISKTYPGGARYVLSGNMDTDKKHSSINMLLTRGRRVVAEAVIRKDILRDLMGVDSKALFRTRQISNAGAFLAGSANNGSQTPNGLAAMFIATGQDVADISEFAGRGDLFTTPGERRLLLVGDAYLPHRRHCRGRDRPCDAARMPRDARLRWPGKSRQVCRNLRGRSARRRNVPRERSS